MGPSVSAPAATRGKRWTGLWAAAVASAVLQLLGCASAPEASRSPVPPAWPALPDVPSRLPADLSDDVAIHAMGLVGTPYRYGGNTPQGGFDCSGLIAYVFNASTGLTPPRTVSRLQTWGQAVSRPQARTGDLVLFAQRNEVTHAGIYVGDDRFVHAPSAGGEVRLDHLNSAYWSRQQVQFRRP